MERELEHELETTMWGFVFRIASPKRRIKSTTTSKNEIATGLH